ncbi:hypothetical protein [Nonomuraea angiospora]|uniref:hypothetical protein n=1 Tax=Nonomuraea angiospora TaxID=46172 RepID=UPI0029A89BA7|nr:hypothetical protein [Nonomuraea angiospora]MDX3099717.1 hypothetical protein [Nonomuraea angiospora]
MYKFENQLGRTVESLLKFTAPDADSVNDKVEVEGTTPDVREGAATIGHGSLKVTIKGDRGADCKIEAHGTDSDPLGYKVIATLGFHVTSQIMDETTYPVTLWDKTADESLGGFPRSAVSEREPAGEVNLDMRYEGSRVIPWLSLDKVAGHTIPRLGLGQSVDKPRVVDVVRSIAERASSAPSEVR